MAIIIEDGTGKSTSESYISMVDATEYFTARGNTTWAAIATDALREAALRKATEYMVNTFRDRWQGWRKTEDQALCWPRYDVMVEGYLVDDDSVPTIIARACAELAIRAAVGDLSADLTQGVLSEQVGVISVQYDRASPQKTRYASVDTMLKPFLKPGSSGVSVGLVRT